MKHLKIYEDFNNLDLKELFNLVLSNIEVIEIPYSYMGSVKDFNIYVITGNKLESDDGKLVQDLYLNHKILNNLYNLEFFYIKLTDSVATIVLFDYLSKHNDKNHLSRIPYNLFKGLAKERLKDSFSFYLLHKGIDWSDGSSSNLGLYDWVYESVFESNQNILQDIKDIFIELEDDGFLCRLLDKNSLPITDETINFNDLSIHILKRPRKVNEKVPFKFNAEVKDVLLRIYQYMRELGFRSELATNFGIVAKKFVIRPDERFIYLNGSFIDDNHEVLNIKLNFYKNL